MEKQVAIPSYSEVLFLPEGKANKKEVKSRNPFLFRGPIPTSLRSSSGTCSCRNPFLFRGPIPTRGRSLVRRGGRESQSLLIQRSYSYTEPKGWIELPFRSQSLLIQRSYSYYYQPGNFDSRQYVAIPSYSEVLFLLPCNKGGRGGF